MSMPDFSYNRLVQVDQSLMDLMMCTVVVTEIGIYKRPLDRCLLQNFLNHHFIIVEISALVYPGGENSKEGLLIRAEKKRKVVCREELRIKKTILIQKVDFIREGRDGEPKYTAGDIRVSIPMVKLLEILTMHRPHYDLLNYNCWKYTDATCRELLKTFLQLKPENGEHIRKHLNRIPRLVSPKSIPTCLVVPKPVDT